MTLVQPGQPHPPAESPNINTSLADGPRPPCPPHSRKLSPDVSHAPSHIGGCRKTFSFAVAESPKIGEAGEEVSKPTRTSTGRVKRVTTLPASFASRAIPIPPTCTSADNRGLDVISSDVMSSEPAAGDKRSALDAPDTDDDDGCAEQGEGAGATGPRPEQAGTSKKKHRQDVEARNLSQQQRGGRGGAAR